jgi:hypothetical protein
MISVWLTHAMPAYTEYLVPRQAEACVLVAPGSVLAMLCEGQPWWREARAGEARADLHASASRRTGLGEGGR